MYWRFGVICSQLTLIRLINLQLEDDRLPDLRRDLRLDGNKPIERLSDAAVVARIMSVSLR